jgi:hypothetical protein
MVNKKFGLGILVMILVFGMTVVGCEEEPTDDGGDDNTPKMGSFVNESDANAGLSLVYSIDGGVITITVAGVPNNVNPWTDGWKAQFWYSFKGTVGVKYEYKFNAWVEEGSSYMISTIRYLRDNVNNIEKYLQGTSALNLNTNSEKVYSFTSDPFIDADNQDLAFYCGIRNGTFKLKIISIKPVV